MNIINTLSVTMLDKFPANIHIEEVTLKKAAKLAVKMVRVHGVTSYVNNKAQATLFSSLLGIEVDYRPEIFYFKPGDNALLGKYMGDELPEGTTTVPDDAEIRWYLLAIS
jgi:hypothetical protein